MYFAFKLLIDEKSKEGDKIPLKSPAEGVAIAEDVDVAAEQQRLMSHPLDQASYHYLMTKFNVVTIAACLNQLRYQNIK